MLAVVRQIFACDEEDLACGVLGIEPDGIEIGDRGRHQVLVVADFVGDDPFGLLSQWWRERKLIIWRAGREKEKSLQVAILQA